MRRVIVWTLLIIAGFIFVRGCTLYFGQDKLIYYPRRYSEDDLKRHEWVEQLRYSTSQGEQVAFYATNGTIEGQLPRRIWVMAGGNGSLALDWADIVVAEVGPETAQAGSIGFLMIDYPSYGLCEGKPNPETIRESVDGALEALAERLGVSEADLKPRLAAMGHSLGAAVALESAVRYGMERVVLISPFTSMEDMAARIAGRSTANVILRHRFDNRASLAAFAERAASGGGSVRVTIFHGDSDDLIPVEMGQSLARDHAEIVEFHAVPGAGHNDVVWEIRKELAAIILGE